MLAGVQRVFYNVASRDGGCSGGRGKIAGEHAQSCCLACAVRSEKTYNLSLFNSEGGIFNRLKAAELFGKLVGVNHRISGNRVILIQTAAASS